MIREGTDVKWAWGDGTATATVIETHSTKIERDIDGATVTRNGTQGDPALVLQQSDGQIVLKLKSEVERAD